MEITAVSATPVAVPLEVKVSGSGYVKRRRATLAVTVETDAGVTGRVYSGDILDTSPEKADRLVEFVEERIADVFVGEDLLATEATWERSFARSREFFAYEVGDRQLYVHALGAVDLARWDAIGKALEIPLYKLWGGYRDSVPIIAIGGYYHGLEFDLDGLVDEMKTYEDMELAGVKLKVGGRDPETDLRRLAAVRDTMGKEFVIACDANQGYTTEEAIAFAEGAREYNVEWFEEPVYWDQEVGGMAEVRRQTGVPVAAGQSESIAAGCRRLIEEEAVDVLNLDASIAGGPTQWRRVAATAAVHGVDMTHHEEPHVSMHLLASIPHGRYAECFLPELDPIWHEGYENPPTVANGRLHLPDAPGLGLTVDESFVTEHELTDSS